MAQINIAGTLHNTEEIQGDALNSHVVAHADEILDSTQEKKQSEVNADVDTALADRYTKEETYSKSQVDNLITTPEVQYVTVATYSALPATGEADTIYRVASWDGTAVDAGKYSEYAWNGSAYQLLAVRSGSLDGVFDISANNLTEGQPTQYAGLVAALGTNGANVPVGVRAGGMQVRFINTSGKYEQCRYMGTDVTTAATFTDISNWQGVDETPTAGSSNLATSGGIVNMYGGTRNIEFDVIANTALNKKIDFVCKNGVTYKLKLNRNGNIDTTGVTAIIKSGDSEITRFTVNDAGYDYIASGDSDTIVLSRSASYITGTGICSIDASVPYIFNTKEEIEQIETEQTTQLTNQLTVNAANNVSTGGKEFVRGTTSIASDIAVQNDVYKFGSTKSTDRTLNVGTIRRFTLNFPIIEGNTYKIKFGTLSGTWGYNIYDASDGTTIIVSGSASSLSENEFTAADSYDNIQILFASGITEQTIKLSLSDLTIGSEYTDTFATKTELSAVDEKVDTLIYGGDKDLTSSLIRHSPDGYYTGSAGNTIGFSETKNSVAYNALDLSDYIGKNVNVIITNATQDSGRKTVLCDSSGVIGVAVKEDDFYKKEDHTYTFKPTSTYKYLYVSHKNTATSQVKVEVESLESTIIDEVESIVQGSDFVYVSPNGSNSNDGTALSPFATIAKALSVSNKVMLLDGTYQKETIVPSDYDYDEITIIGAEAQRAIINFGDNYLVNDGSESLVSGYTKVYQVACATMPFASGCTNAFMWQDYVDDASTLIEDIDRHPLYRGRTHRCDSTKIKQVSSIAAIEALGPNQYGWYWENGIMYFSRPQASSAVHPIVLPRRDDWFINMGPNKTARKQIKVVLNNIEVRYAGIQLDYTANCELSDILVKYNYVSSGGCFYIYACQNCSLVRCEAAGVTNGDHTGDGFNVDTAGVQDDPKALCLSLYMRDCWAHDVNDDGYSDHDNSEVTIEGGLFEYCGKGGLTPSYGSNDIIRNAICRYNSGSGIVVGGEPSVNRQKTNVVAHNCVCYGQDYGFKANAFGEMKCYSCISYDNQEAGFYAHPNGHIYVMNCKSGDTNPISGNVIVQSLSDLQV